MTRTRIKICGLRRKEDISYVNEVLPDFAGFIFDPSRRRYINPETAAVLRPQLADSIRAVGVFVNAAPEEILRIAETVRLDLIQLHGSEDDTYIRNLRKQTSLPIIKAIRVRTEEDTTHATASSADLILLDNGAGGTGTRFNWELAQKVSRDFLLQEESQRRMPQTPSGCAIHGGSMPVLPWKQRE